MMWKVPCLWQRGLNYIISKVPSSPKHSVIPRARLCIQLSLLQSGAAVIFSLKAEAAKPMPCASVHVCVLSQLQPLLVYPSVNTVGRMSGAIGAHGRAPAAVPVGSEMPRMHVPGRCFPLWKASAWLVHLSPLLLKEF